MVWLPLVLEIFGNMYMYCNCLFSILWRLSFEINLRFLIKPFFNITKMSGEKQIFQERNRLLTWNKKNFFIIFEELSLKQLSTFFEGESPTLTLFRMGGGGGRGDQKKTPAGFSPVTSTNVGIRPPNVLTFSFNSFDRLV